MRFIGRKLIFHLQVFVNSFWVRDGACIHFFQFEDPLVQNCQSCVCCHSLWELMFVGPAMYERLGSLGVFHLFWLLRHFLPPLLQSSLTLEDEVLMETFNLGLCVLRSLNLYVLFDIGFLYLFLSAAGGGFADDGRARY